MPDTHGQQRSDRAFKSTRSGDPRELKLDWREGNNPFFDIGGTGSLLLRRGRLLALALIEAKKQEFAKLPLFSFMRRKDIDPWQRVAWAPAFAPYVHAFGDINQYVFPERPADTQLREMINNHAAEDGKHWHWSSKTSTRSASIPPRSTATR